MNDSYYFAKYLYTDSLLSQYLYWCKSNNKITKWLVKVFVNKLIKYGKSQISQNSICNNWSFHQIIYCEGLKSKRVLLPNHIKEVEKDWYENARKH